MCNEMFDTGIEPVTSIVGGRHLDDWATEVPIRKPKVLMKNLEQQLLQKSLSKRYYMISVCFKSQACNTNTIPIYWQWTVQLEEF